MGTEYFEDKKEHISNLVKQGYTEGYHPRWILEANEEITENDATMENIANLILKGNTEGYHPRWKLLEKK